MIEITVEEAYEIIAFKHKKYPRDNEKYFIVRYWENGEEE